MSCPKDITNDVYKGSRILIDDGLIELIVDDITDKDVNCIEMEEYWET